MGLERRGTYGTYSVCMVGNRKEERAEGPTESAVEEAAPAPDGQEAILGAVTALLVEAARRSEALGIPGDVTESEYRAFLGELLAEAARGDAGLAVAVRGDGEVIGTAQWRRSPYRTRRGLAELDRVAVVRQARGGGIGRALVEAIVADAQGHGVELLSLEARGNNHGAVALYERLGFRRAGLLPNAVAVGRTRYDVLTMCRELDRPAGLDLLGSLPAGAGASLPRGTGQGLHWQRTDRLLLCRPAVTDADSYFAINADPATNVHNPAGPMVDPAGALPVLELWARHWREEGYGYWTVRDPETGQVLGFAGVRPPLRGEDFINLYYRFRPSAWGKGYATEVGRAALALAAKAAPGRVVVALIRPKNEPSVAVARRLGMHPEGEVERELGRYLRFTLVP
jgi:RimJ/RimL family protein N-acetyltransferase